VYKIGQCIIDRQTNELYEITKVWGYVQAKSVNLVGIFEGTYYFSIEQLDKEFKVLPSVSAAAQLLYSNKAKAVTNGKPTEP